MAPSTDNNGIGDSRKNARTTIAFFNYKIHFIIKSDHCNFSSYYNSQITIPIISSRKEMYIRIYPFY